MQAISVCVMVAVCAANIYILDYLCSVNNLAKIRCLCARVWRSEAGAYVKILGNQVVGIFAVYIYPIGQPGLGSFGLVV